jgi:hypothetical protein
MLRVQYDQLEVYRKQVDEQRTTGAEQMRVLGLQAAEIRASLAERRSAGQQGLHLDRSRPGSPWQPGGAAGQWSGGLHDQRVREERQRPPHLQRGALVDDGSSAVSDIAARSGGERLAPVLLPDAHETSGRNVRPDSRTVVLRFRDAAGFSWLRSPEGELLDLSARAESGAGETASKNSA